MLVNNVEHLAAREPDIFPYKLVNMKSEPKGEWMLECCICWKFTSWILNILYLCCAYSLCFRWPLLVKALLYWHSQEVGGFSTPLLCHYCITVVPMFCRTHCMTWQMSQATEWKFSGEETPFKGEKKQSLGSDQPWNEHYYNVSWYYNLCTVALWI